MLVQFIKLEVVILMDVLAIRQEYLETAHERTLIGNIVGCDNFIVLNRKNLSIRFF
ncbi:MAG: hypothetical protein LBU55_04825 [Elusimicrobiota bacterium]|jgi:hypothetical protein|nr:hypothetical protein [Elusimicrobiota bacterium]